MSRLRANKITNQAADGAPTVENGLIISGVTTVTTLDLNGDLDVDGHLNADNVSIAGVATATSFVGSGANLTSLPAANLTGTLPAISGANLTNLPVPTINNQSDNRMITCTGTSNTLNAEQYLTYTSQSSLNLTDGNGTSILGGNYLLLKRTTANTNYINAPLDNADLVISADRNLLFHTVHTADYNSTERIRIDSSGRLLIGTTTEGHGNADELTISFNNTGVSGGDQGRCGMTIRSGDNTSGVTQNGYIYFSDGTSGGNEYSGVVGYSHSDDSMYFSTNETERFRITSQGTLFAKAAGTAPVNQGEAGHYSGSGYNAGNALGLMVKRAIHVSDADTKGVGGMFLSHTRNVACNGTTYNMFTLHNREGTFIGDIYVGFSANSAGAVRQYRFTCLYGTNTLTSVQFNRRTNNENLTCNISSSGTSHFFQVIPTMSGGSVQRVSMTIVGAMCGRNDGSGGDFYTVSYNS